jgi:hypothetical protein
MGSLTPGAMYIYESSDDGKTVYAREFGTNEKKLIGQTFTAQELEKEYNNEMLWREMNRAAKTNEALQRAMEYAIIIYHMSKDNG